MVDLVPDLALKVMPGLFTAVLDTSLLLVSETSNRIAKTQKFNE
jgi:hypothetical protein